MMTLKEVAAKKKITLATFKTYVKKNRTNLLILVKSKFDGSTDGVESTNKTEYTPVTNRERAVASTKQRSASTAFGWFAAATTFIRPLRIRLRASKESKSITVAARSASASRSRPKGHKPEGLGESMNNRQLSAALTLAQSDADLSGHDERPFDGCCLKGFREIFVTIPQVAKLLRSNVVRLDGTLDSEEMANIGHVGRHKFTVIGEGA